MAQTSKRDKNRKIDNNFSLKKKVVDWLALASPECPALLGCDDDDGGGGGGDDTAPIIC